MSLIFPKKEILYAPMLGTLGGGSARGWGRGKGRHPFEIPFSSFSLTFNNGDTRGREPASESTYRNNASVSTDAGTAWLNDSNYFSAPNGYINFRPLMQKTYRITAYGAGVPTRTGGNGARIQGEFVLTPDDILLIVLGQQGYPYDQSTGAAGGGTFVVKKSSSSYTNSDILVIAGGGGGGHGYGVVNESHGNDTATGGAGSNNHRASTNGYGGPSPAGQGGAGFFGNGATLSGQTYGARSFINGATGGGNMGSQGGFGGGGAHGNSHGGGAGGYTGGAGSSVHPYQGGGGGSYNNGANQNNQRGSWNSHGKVEIVAL